MRMSKAKGLSEGAAALLHYCHVVDVYRNPAHLRGPAAGCALSSVVPLEKLKHVTHLCTFLVYLRCVNKQVCRKHFATCTRQVFVVVKHLGGW